MAVSSPQIRYRVPYPHPGQQAVLAGAQRFNWLSCGRRWRKTTLVMSIALLEMIRGGEVIWGAPTADQVATGYEELRRALEFIPSKIVRCTASPHPEARHRSGGIIRYRSLDDPDNARSKSATMIVIDEAGDVAEYAWTDVLRPMLVDSLGSAWIIGTPRGHNWFYRGWQAACTGEYPGEIAYQAPTYGVEIVDEQLIRRPHPLENPNIDLQEMLAIWRTTPERTFRQEYLAEFVADGGGVLRHVAERSTLQPQAGPIKGHEYVMGCDWGRSNDYTTICVIDATLGQQAYLERFTGIGYELQRGRWIGAYERWLPTLAYGELNSMGGPIVERFQADGYPVVGLDTSNQSKAKWVDALSLALERNRIGLLNDPIQIAELQAFEGTRLPSGMIRYAAPDGQHDDTVIALLLAWHAAKNYQSEPIPEAAPPADEDDVQEFLADLSHKMQTGAWDDNEGEVSAEW